MTVERIRLRYTKLGKVRFLGHRDLARGLERALRRAEIPVGRTAGFSPRAKVAFGLALPTGAESTAEFLDLDLVEDAALDIEGLPGLLSTVLPPGVDITAAAHVPPGEDSLQQAVTASEWEVDLGGVDPLEATAGVERALSATSLPFTYERKGVQADADLRPALLSLAVLLPVVIGEACRLHLELASAAGAGRRTVRPSEVVQALWPHLGPGRVRRVAQWIDRDDERREPLPLPPTAAVAPHASGRAPVSRSPHDRADRVLGASRGHPDPGPERSPGAGYTGPERPPGAGHPGPERPPGAGRHDLFRTAEPAGAVGG